MEFFALVEPDGKVGRTYPLIFQPRVERADPLDTGFVEGNEVPSKPIELIREAGSGTCDFHSIRHMGGYVVSMGFTEALRIHECSGWGTYPVIVRAKKDALLEGYEGLVVLGRATSIDRSKVRELRYPHPLGFTQIVHVGYRIPEASWDGKDVFFVFTPSGGMGLNIFLTERAAIALRSRPFKGFTIEAVSKVQWTQKY